MDERLTLCDGPARGLSIPEHVRPALLELNVAYQRGLYDWPETRARLVDETARYGFCASDWDLIEHGIIVGPKSDAEEVVHHCETNGFRLGILSNTCELHVSQFESFNFLKSIPEEFRVYSHREKVFKPEPAAYHRFEEVTATSAESIVFFDDTPVNVTAARSLGWTAFHVPRGEPVLPVFVDALKQL